MTIWILILLAACSSERTIYREAPTNFELLRNGGALQEPPSPSKAAGLIKSCCPKSKSTVPEALPACRELQRMIEHEPSPALFQNWGPSCYRAISPVALRNGLSKDPSAIADVLGSVEPGAPTVEALFGELIKKPSPQLHEEINEPEASLLRELALIGEDELPVIGRHLTGTVPNARAWAVIVLWNAAASPLGVSKAYAQLDLVARADDLDGKRARRALAAWLEWNAFADYDELARKLLSQPPIKAIKLLTRRQVYCRSRVAVVMLAMFARDSDPALADLASRAIEDRNRRCRLDTATND